MKAKNSHWILFINIFLTVIFYLTWIFIFARRLKRWLTQLYVRKYLHMLMCNEALQLMYTYDCIQSAQKAIIHQKLPAHQTFRTFPRENQTEPHMVRVLNFSTDVSNENCSWTDGVSHVDINDLRTLYNSKIYCIT